MNRITHKLFSTLLLAAAGAAAMCSAQAAPVHALGDQAPVGFNVGGVANAARGWTFSLGVPAITVTELGLITPHGDTNTTRVATLWDFTTSTVLAQTSVAAGSGWVWTTIAPVTLTAGHDYLVSYFSEVADYYFAAPGSNWRPSGDVVYQDMRYCNFCTANSVATNVLNGFQYGLIDIGYTVGAQNSVPESGAFGLVTLAGLLALTAARRSKTA